MRKKHQASTQGQWPCADYFFAPEAALEAAGAAGLAAAALSSFFIAAGAAPEAGLPAWEAANAPVVAKAATIRAARSLFICSFLSGVEFASAEWEARDETQRVVDRLTTR